MNIEEIEKELNELKKRSLLCFETLGFQQLRQENMESVLKGNVAKGFDLILKRDIAISRNDNKFFGDGIFQQDLAKLKNDIYRKLFSEGEKDSKPDSNPFSGTLRDCVEPVKGEKNTWKFTEEFIKGYPNEKPDSDTIEHLTLEGAITFLSKHKKNLVYTKKEIEHLIDAFLTDKILISREQLEGILAWMECDLGCMGESDERLYKSLKQVEQP